MKNSKSLSHSYLTIVIIFMIISLVSETAYLVILNNKFTVMSKDLSSLNENYNTFKSDINTENRLLKSNDDSIKQSIEKLNKNLSQSETNLKKQINDIEIKSSTDFSAIIQKSLDSVVSIKTDLAQGTGFIISSDGYVITNEHVIDGAGYANAITSDKETIPMTLIGYDKNLDLALLKINGTYDHLEFANSDDVKIGEKVVAIGNPLGLSFSATEGIISAVNREGKNNLPDYLQTDASLNPGNSGGPLINAEGKVIGINNFKANAESIGFALESNTIVDWINQISKQRLNSTIS